MYLIHIYTHTPTTIHSQCILDYNNQRFYKTNKKESNTWSRILRKKLGLKARCPDASHRHLLSFSLFPRGRNCGRAHIVTFAVVSRRRGWSTGRTVEGSSFSRNWRARVCPSGMGQTWFRNSQWTHFNPVPARLDEKDSSREMRVPWYFIKPRRNCYPRSLRKVDATIGIGYRKFPSTARLTVRFDQSYN